MTDVAPSPTDRIIDAAAALEAEAAVGEIEKRSQKRHAYEALVALLLVEADGTRRPPTLLRACDLSAGGISVVGSRRLPEGCDGVLQLVRMDGRFALVGVQMRHCRYLGSLIHQSGLQFIPLPSSFSREEFLDDDGRMILLDPLLKQNCG